METYDINEINEMMSDKYIIIIDNVAYDITNLMTYINAAFIELNMENIVTFPEYGDMDGVIELLDSNFVQHIMIRKPIFDMYVEGHREIVLMSVDLQDTRYSSNILTTVIGRVKNNKNNSLVLGLYRIIN